MARKHAGEAVSISHSPESGNVFHVVVVVVVIAFLSQHYQKS